MTAPWCMALIDLPVPTTMSRDTSNRTASRPTRSCSDIASSPSSAISPSTAQLPRSFRRRCGRIQASAFRPARTESGFALYASLMTVTPSPRVATCMRCFDTGPAAASAPATWSMLAPHSRATAAAHSAFDTWCSPCTASATSVWPSAVCSVKRGLASSSSVTGPAHVSRRRPTVPADPHHPVPRHVGHRGDRRVVDVEDDHSGRPEPLAGVRLWCRRWLGVSRIRPGVRFRRSARPRSTAALSRRARRCCPDGAPTAPE